jgi:hypothetical protein
VSVWATQAPEEPPEYWLADDEMDIGTFLKALLSEKKRLIRPDRMLSYKADVRFEPFVRGCVEHGDDVSFIFTKHLSVVSTVAHPQ